MAAFRNDAVRNKHTASYLLHYYQSGTSEGFGSFLKNAWANEPVLTVASAIGILAVILPFVSPYTELTAKLNKAVPYNYPVPVRDNGNMPDVPSHPLDKVGPNLDWFKNM